MKIYCLDEYLYQGGQPDSPLPEYITAMLTLNKVYEEIYHPIIWLQCPFDDGIFPGIKWLNAIINIIDELIRQNHKVYVHCLAGMSRSAMICAAWLMKKYNLDYKEALEKIAMKNSNIDPSPKFILSLKEWHHFLQNNQD